MENNISILNEYMCNLKVEINNLYNLHFNVSGNSFMGLHNLLETYYKKLSKFYDKISERIKMLGGFPITSLEKIEDTSTIKSMKSMDFSGNQVLEVLDNDFNFLTEYTKDLIKLFNEKNDYYTKFMLNKFLMFFEKELWKIKSSLK